MTKTRKPIFDHSLNKDFNQSIYFNINISKLIDKQKRDEEILTIAWESFTSCNVTRISPNLFVSFNKLNEKIRFSFNLFLVISISVTRIHCIDVICTVFAVIFDQKKWHLLFFKMIILTCNPECFTEYMDYSV